MWRPDTILALPEDIISFAWSAPMRELAAQIGISDVGLRKLLKAHGIATPPQGHWNRVHAGRAVAAPPKPRARGPGESGRVILDMRFRGHVPETPSMREEGPFASRLVPEDLAELRALELKAIGKAIAPRDLSRPPVGMARLLRKEAERREKAAVSRWSSDDAHFDHPLAQRQLRLLAGLLTALAKRGHAGEVWEDAYDLRARSTIGNQTLGLRFEVIGKHGTEWRDGHQRPARDLPAKTPLRLALDRSLRGSLTTAWTDSPILPLEKQLAQIAADVIVAGEGSFRQSLVEARERAEEHRRWEEERRLARLAELGRNRLANLVTSGELLRQAEDIRALIARVEQALMRDGSSVVSSDQLAHWKSWALAQADDLDPVLSGQVLTHLHVPELDDLE